MKPTRSANSTLTSLRSSTRGGAGAATGAPHALQKRASAGFS